MKTASGCIILTGKLWKNSNKTQTADDEQIGEPTWKVELKNERNERQFQIRTKRGSLRKFEKFVSRPFYVVKLFYPNQDDFS
jgi:hypothetical protein